MQDDFRPAKGSVKPSPKLKPIPSTPKINLTELDAHFETPEQVSAHDAKVEDDLQAVKPLLASDTTKGKPQKTARRRLQLRWPPSKQTIILSAVMLFIVGFTATGYVLLNKTEPVKTATPVVVKKKAAAAPKPTTVAATLSGLMVAPEVNQRPVVGVMIENSQTARPQSGLSEAGVIFEAIAEGGITRFLALFQDQQPTNIGPVRSARSYYVQWNEGFRAAYAHVGGSPEALANIKSWNVQDLNQFAYSAPYHRVSSRPAPHNLYSSVVDLATLASQKGFKSDYTGFARKAAAPVATPAASSIDFAISSALYNSHFAYDAASNSYLRSEGGEPQTDANTAKQLSPNVVIAMVVPLSAGGKTSQGGSYSDYNPIGSGQAYIFQDGGVTVGSWTKTSNTAQITFADQTGASVKLNPGQTWITALSASNKVTYK